MKIPHNYSTDYRIIIKSIKRDRKLSYKEICKDNGVSYPYLKQILYRDCDTPDNSIILKILDGLKVTDKADRQYISDLARIERILEKVGTEIKGLSDRSIDELVDRILKY